MLALTFVLLVTAAIALAIEPNKLVALQTLGAAILAVVCAYAGAALAARIARRVS